MNQANQLFASLTQRIGELLPGVAGAILVLIIGLIIAWSIKKLILVLFKQVNIDERVNQKLNSSFKLDQFVARLVYFLILIYVLLVVLDMMGIEGVLDPLSNMMSEFLGFMPNIAASILIGIAGYVVATLASEATGFVALAAENVSERAGLKGNLSISNIIKQLVFIFVFIPILIAALDALQLKVISEPATAMFNEFLQTIPQILAAVAILTIFYVAGKYIVTLLTDLLHNLGVDKLSDALGLASFTSDKKTLSSLIGNIAFFFLMFGGVIAAVEKLNMPQITAILNNVFDISGKVFFGSIILFLGNYLSNLAKKVITESENNEWLGSLAKFAVLFIFLALGLNTMGIATEVVNLGFGLSIGALAVAFALAFGLGGREAAGKYLETFFKKLSEKN